LVQWIVVQGLTMQAKKTQPPTCNDDSREPRTQNKKKFKPDDLLNLLVVWTAF